MKEILALLWNINLKMYNFVRTSKNDKHFYEVYYMYCFAIVVTAEVYYTII